MRLLGSLAIFVLALLASTPSLAALKDRAFDPAPYNAMQVGQTSKADVLKALGEADAAMPARDGHSVLIYEYVVPAKGQEPAKYLTIAVLFDPDDHFVRFRVYERDPAITGY